jgi:hypothetical protein
VLKFSSHLCESLAAVAVSRQLQGQLVKCRRRLEQICRVEFGALDDRYLIDLAVNHSVGLRDQGKTGVWSDILDEGLIDGATDLSGRLTEVAAQIPELVRKVSSCLLTGEGARCDPRKQDTTEGRQYSASSEKSCPVARIRATHRRDVYPNANQDDA